MLASVLLLVIAPRTHALAEAGKISRDTQSAAVEAISAYAAQASPTVSPEQPEEQQATIQQSEDGSLTQEPEETESSEPEETPAPETANGDFSSVFPSADTGNGALLSYQSDTLRVAITKTQANEVTYFVADVWVKNIEAFHTAFAGGKYGGGHDLPLNIAKDNNAVFAVSGDYYGAREEGAVVRNGVLYRDVMSSDVCVLKTDGTLQVYHKGSFSALDTLNDTVWQAWAFGPALVENGAASDTSSSKVKVKNPRSAIGYYEPGHYCFIVADGRQKDYSVGMTLDELANVFASLGCKTAYNLDGGATAMMIFKGAVVNQPTNGGRSSSDIICF
jgi:uncharacterized protein YigE (DUF2233 family)